MKNSLYCFTSIPQPGASVHFYDFLKKDKDGIKYSVDELLKNYNNKKFKKVKTNSFDFTSFADGAYPLYVKINTFKKVETIYLELNNNCGWGSSMFFERPQRLIDQIKAKKTMPKGYQIDMTLAPAMSVQFKSRNRKGYFTFDDWEIDGKKFVKKKKATKKLLGQLEIKSGLIVFDDYGKIDKLDEKIDFKAIYKKSIEQKSYYGVDDGLLFERVFVPVKNKKYPIFIHDIKKTDEEIINDISKDLPDFGRVSPIFPIISIQNIDGCYLSKDKDAKLIFIKKEEKNISEYLKFQIKTKAKNLRLCQLDLDNLCSLKFINKLNYKIDKLFLSGLTHIDDWKPLKNIKNVNTIIFDNCSINKDLLNHTNLIEELNKKKINTLVGTRMVNYAVRKYNDEMEGEDGFYYEGEFNTKWQMHGFGILESNKSGANYSGYFKNGNFHGLGSLLLDSGSWYLGDWKNGLQDGNGIFISKDGFRYTGKFKNNKYHGDGIFYISKTGDEYKVKHNEGVEIKSEKKK